MTCKCRTCGKHYKEDRATADWKGFCSQKCLHKKTRELGWSPHKGKHPGISEYAVLRRNNQIGSVYVENVPDRR